MPLIYDMYDFWWSAYYVNREGKLCETARFKTVGNLRIFLEAANKEQT